MDNSINERLIQAMEAQTAALVNLAQKEAVHEKAPAAFSTYTPLHGPGGIWTGAGIERDVVNAHVRPFGLAQQLPVLPTVFTNPQFGTLTGFTDAGTTQPANSCDDADAAYVKGCNLTARFGLFRIDSQTIDMDDVMLRLHRGDFTDLNLRGQVLGLSGLNPSTTNQTDILNLVSASEMVTMGVNTERHLSRQLWQGSVALGQFPGLDAQIATGQVDADTGQACPALDSDVKNFAYNNVDGSDGRSIVTYLSQLEWYLRYNAMTMGLDPVKWVIAMRPELWFELTAIWPCAYNTNRCAGSVEGDASRVFVDGRENVAERDRMRQSMTIDINGNTYPVVVDTGIFEHNNVNNGNVPAGSYASSIYFVPLTITGNMPVLYREYLDYRQAASDVSLTNGNLGVWWTDNGLFSWSLTQEKWCYKFHLKTQQRVVLRTPHLAGKIDAVLYSPLQHLRESYPDSAYHNDGGVSLRAVPAAQNAVWLS